MNRAIKTLVRVTLRTGMLAMLITAAGLAAFPLASRSATSVTDSASSGIDYLPNVTLTNQDGKAVSLASFKGKPVLVSFIHASCKGVCELMTAKMKSIVTDLGADGAKVTMVSITTDPAEDRPAELKAYANKEGVADDGFVLLTGKSGVVKRVLALYGVNQKPGENEMTHVFSLFLLGPDGHVIRRYHGPGIDAAKVAGDIQQTLAHS